MRATVKVTGQTGVEMEALTAVSVACLTVYDMVKAVERGMTIENIHLVEKSGGKSGHYRAPNGRLTMALLSVADALAMVLAERRRVAGRERAARRRCGRVLAADIVALRTQPPADVSAMDGYAVRADDVAAAPARLTVVGEVAAGHPFDADRAGRSGAHLHRRGNAARAPTPWSSRRSPTRDGDIVVIQRREAKGRNVRRQGLDFAAGRRCSPRATG